MYITFAEIENKLIDYAPTIDTILEDACYQIIKRARLHHGLTGEQWDAEAREMAQRLKPVVEGHLVTIEQMVEGDERR
jgi:hypothetical protein